MARVPNPHDDELGKVLKRQARRIRTQGSGSPLDHSALTPGGVLNLSEGTVIGLPSAEPDTEAPPVLAAPTLGLAMGAVGVRTSGLGVNGEAIPDDYLHAIPQWSRNGSDWENAQPIPGGAGGTVIYGQAAGTLYVRLLAVDTSGNVAAPSPVATIEVVPIESAQSVRDELAAATAQAEQDLADLDEALRGAFTQADEAVALTAASAASTAKTEAIAAAATDATSKANAAKTAAETAAAADATAKAATAKAEALTAAATDATSKANAAAATAKAEALTAAATDAQSKANAARDAAIAAAATDATSKADAARTTAISSAATDAQTKANAARDAAITAAAADATSKANAAKTAAEAAAAADATAKAATAKAEALTAAATTAQQKADAAAATAKAEALTAAATDAQTKADAARDAAIAAAATDATTKANAAQTAATNVANALPKVFHSTVVPGTTAAPNSSTWFQHGGTLSGSVIAQWTRVAGAWVSTPVDSQAIANLDVGKLTAGTATVIEAVTEKLLANEAVINRLTSEQAWIGDVMIADGAVTAEKMNFVRDGSNARLRIVPEGIILESDRLDGAEIFRLDGESPFTIAIQDGAGNVVASIDEDGAGTFTKVVAGESLTYRGEELSEYIDYMPRLVARTQRISQVGVRSTSSSSHNQPVMRLDFVAKANMLYLIRAEGLTATSAGVNTRARWRLNGETSGQPATVSSSTWQEVVSAPRASAANILPGVVLTRHFPNGNEQRDVSVLVSYSAFGGADAVTMQASTTAPMTMEVYEYPLIAVSGFADYKGTTLQNDPPEPQVSAPVTRVETWTAVQTRSWSGSNSIRSTNGTMYQGYSSYYPAGGTSVSQAMFNLGDRNGQTIAATLTGSTVRKIEAYVYFDHWHTASGGYAGIAMHNTHGAANPPIPSFTGSAIVAAKMSRGEGKWITLPVSDLEAGLKSGAFRGFGVRPPSGYSTTQTYGTAHGGLGSWKTPKLRVTYEK